MRAERFGSWRNSRHFESVRYLAKPTPLLLFRLDMGNIKRRVSIAPRNEAALFLVHGRRRKYLLLPRTLAFWGSCYPCSRHSHDCASPRCPVRTDFRNRKLTLFRLIAIMLGRLRMDDREVLSTFRETMSEVFSPTNIRSRIPLTSKYHHKTLETNVRNTVATHCKQHSYRVLCGADMLVWPWEVDKERLTGSSEPEYSPGDAICQT